MAFEIYHARQRETAPKEVKKIVAISKQSIVLNKPVRQLLNLNGEQAQFIELGWDKKTKQIRLRVVGEGEGGVRLKKSKLYAKGFLSKFGIKAQGKFENLVFNPDDNSVIVNLKETK
jgi:phosphoribosylamine-glycine ligase